MRALLTLIAAAALLTACGGDEEENQGGANGAGTSTPAVAASPTGPATPKPTSAGAPAIVYRKNTRDQTLVVYDLRTNRQLSSITPTDREFILDVEVSGRQLLLATGQAVRLLQVDGSLVEEVFRRSADWESVTALDLSPDAKTLAIVINRDYEIVGSPGPTGQIPVRPRPHSVVFYDLGAKKEISRINSTRNELAGLRGIFGDVFWRDDGKGVLLKTSTQSHAPGNYATLFLDGRIVVHDLEGFAYLAPNARVAVSGIRSLGCDMVSSHSLVLRDLDTGRNLVSHSDSGLAFTGVDWAPDGSEFLFESRPFNDSCSSGWFRATPEYYVASLATGDVRRVPDRESVYRRWYGDSLVWVECGQFVPLARAFHSDQYAHCTSGGGILRLGQQAVDTSDFFMFFGFLQ